MTLKWVPSHELVPLNSDDCGCFLCRRRAQYIFKFFHNTTREQRRYCVKHAKRAAKRHHIPMPMRG